MSKVSSRLTNCISYSYILYLFLLQTVYVFLFLANYHLVNCIYVLFLLQIIILQTVYEFIFLGNYHLANCIYALFLQRCTLSYGLVSHGADVDLRFFPLVRAYLNGLSFVSVSKKRSSYSVIITCVKVSF